MIRVMRLYKRHKNGKLLSYYVELPGGQRQSLKTKDRVQAKRAYRQIEKAALEGRIAKLTGGSTKRIGDFAEEYLKWAETAIENRSTFRANKLALNKLLAVTGKNMVLGAINQKHIDLMIKECRKNGNKAGSINNYIRHIKTVMNKTAEWGYINESPLKDVKQLKEKKRIPGYIKKDMISRVLAKVEDVHVRRYMMAYIVTGRRRSELVYLMWEDIDFDYMKYTPRRSKSHLERAYDVNAAFLSVLNAIGIQKEGRVFDRWEHPDTISHKVKDALVKAGYGHLSLHSLRHTYASMRVSEGLSLKEVQELLGHEDIKATQIYAHLTKDHLAEIAEVNIGPVDLG